MKPFLRSVSLLALCATPALAASADFYSFADTDRDGFLTTEELAAVSPAFTPTVIAELDVDSSGDIVVEEVGRSPLLGGFTFASPAQLRRDAPLIVRRYGSYRAIDRNRDGILSPGEVAAVIPTITRARYVQADLDGDGYISFNELYGWRHYTRLEDTGAVLLPEEAADENSVILDRVRYTRIDLNRDGFISMPELSRIAPDATLRQYASIDANDDGVIVYRELYASDAISADIEKGLFVIPEAETDRVTASRPYVIDSYTYALLDADDDNLLTLAELQAAIPTIRKTEIKGIDFDGDGVIRYDEFSTSPVIVRYYDSDSITVPVREISVERSYFTGIDVNRNGVIEPDELIEVSPAVTMQTYTTVDLNADGVVTYDEFYGTDWFGEAVEKDTIITPAYVYRYYANGKG